MRADVGRGRGALKLILQSNPLATTTQQQMHSRAAGGRASLTGNLLIMDGPGGQFQEDQANDLVRRGPIAAEAALAELSAG